MVVASFAFLILSFREIFEILCCCDTLKAVYSFIFSFHWFALFIWSRNYEDKKIVIYLVYHVGITQLV